MTHTQKDVLTYESNKSFHKKKKINKFYSIFFNFVIVTHLDDSYIPKIFKFIQIFVCHN